MSIRGIRNLIGTSSVRNSSDVAYLAIRSSDNDITGFCMATRFAAYPGCRWAHLTKKSDFSVD